MPNTNNKKMYLINLKSFISSNPNFTCNLSYQKDLKTCQNEFLLMETSTQNYASSPQMDKISIISTILTN